jgi:hypothetical protein
VLGFLAGAAKTGELSVTSESVDGRVLFQAGLVAYATTATGAGTVQELDALLERHQAGGYARWAFGGDADEAPATLEDVLREQLTEVLYHLTLLEDGSFEFTQAPDESNHHALDSFTVDHLLGEVDVRIDAWRQIREVIPSTASLYELVSRLPHGRNEVTLPASQWTLLAALGGEASVSEVAETLDVYEFHAARKFADLVEEGLLKPSDGAGWDLEAGGDEDVSDEAGWDFDPAAEGAPEIPRLEPTNGPVTFSKQDLTREEMDEMIRNIGKGIFPD